jgi:large subunit ribosomal protein L29
MELSMKPNELRENAGEEIQQRIEELEEELFNLRFQQRLGQLANPLRIRMVKREIARAKTIHNEKMREAKTVSQASGE